MSDVLGRRRADVRATIERYNRGVVSFNERVYSLVRRVPPGRVMTYGAIAALLGDARKAREVGWAMHECPDDVPAHRVINSRGAVSGNAVPIQAERRRVLLEAEGVRFDAQGRCDLRRYEWWPDMPLAGGLRLV